MQTGIAEDDYEIILIDNGSTLPFDEALIRSLVPNIHIHRMKKPGPSPVKAINCGLEMARGDLVGVFIDGARMVTPGLLSQAVKAAQIYEHPVIGTLAFHLGSEVQMTSVPKGYNAAVEDALMHTVDWQADGYSLFYVSVLAGSSAQGWFEIPAEANALFMRADDWRDLGGYDEGFVAPGGGLANLDMWKRACDRHADEVVVLLGEATFHQVHGGIATNSPNPPHAAFHDEYVRLRGMPFTRPDIRPQFFGKIHPGMLDSLQKSVEEMDTAAGNPSKLTRLPLHRYRSGL